MITIVKFFKKLMLSTAFLVIARMIYYAAILLALIYLYGFVNELPESNFIYNGF